MIYARSEMVGCVAFYVKLFDTKRPFDTFRLHGFFVQFYSVFLVITGITVGIIVAWWCNDSVLDW